MLTLLCIYDCFDYVNNLILNINIYGHMFTMLCIVFCTKVVNDYTILLFYYIIATTILITKIEYSDKCGADIKKFWK